jgi:hypothetical protein
MADRSWKAFERRLCRDIGTERIPVTGERAGADGETSRFCMQFKLRRTLPTWIFVWLGGICTSADRRGKIGVLVVKRPRMRDEDAVVLLRWADWVALSEATRRRANPVPAASASAVADAPGAVL